MINTNFSILYSSLIQTVEDPRYNKKGKYLIKKIKTTFVDLLQYKWSQSSLTDSSA